MGRKVEFDANFEARILVLMAVEVSLRTFAIEEAEELNFFSPLNRDSKYSVEGGSSLETNLQIDLDAFNYFVSKRFYIPSISFLFSFGI